MSASHLGFVILAHEKEKWVMDKYQQVTSESSLAVHVVGIPALGRFEFRPISGPHEDGAALAAKDGLLYLGIVGIDRDGQPQSAFAVDLTAEQTDRVAEMFLNLVYRVAGHIEQQQQQARLAN